MNTTTTFAQVPQSSVHAGVLRRAAASLRRGLAVCYEVYTEAAEDRRTWELALSDARVMADISRAMNGRVATR